MIDANLVFINSVAIVACYMFLLYSPYLLKYSKHHTVAPMLLLGLYTMTTAFINGIRSAAINGLYNGIESFTVYCVFAITMFVLAIIYQFEYNKEHNNIYEWRTLPWDR